MMSGRRHGVLASKTRKAVVCILFLSSCLYALLWVLRFRHATSAVWHSNKKVKASDGSSSVGESHQWPVVNPAHRHPDEVKHVVFVKVHKAASTTIFNILIRFSMSRDLNVMFPLHGNLLSENTVELAPIIPYPPSPSFRFDILCHHVVFREAQIRPWFPDDTQYVTILRKPWAQLISAFRYYKTVWMKSYLKEVASVSQLVENWRLVEPSDPLISYTNNRMSVDLGLPPEQMHNSSYVSTFVDYLHSTFHVVLIVERFDESLVLMKRRFRWTMKDIVYIKLNSLKQEAEAVSPEPEAKLKEKFRLFSKFDTAVYDHFVKVLENAIEEEGPMFFEELRLFTAIRKRIAYFCDDKRFLKQLVVPKTRWNEPFVVHYEECIIFTMSEIQLNVFARYSQRLRMMAHSCGE